MKDTITFKVKSNITHKYYQKKVAFTNFTITPPQKEDMREVFNNFIKKNVYTNLIDTLADEPKAYKKFLKKVKKYSHKALDKYFKSML